MTKCSAINCDSNKSTDSPKVDSYPFPKTPALRAKWVAATKWTTSNGDWNPPSSATLCAKHFEESAFVPRDEDKTKRGLQRARRTLRDDAVPTVFEFKSKLQSKEKHVVVNISSK